MIRKLFNSYNFEPKCIPAQYLSICGFGLGFVCQADLPVH